MVGSACGSLSNTFLASPTHPVLFPLLFLVLIFPFSPWLVYTNFSIINSFNLLKSFIFFFKHFFFFCLFFPQWILLISFSVFHLFGFLCVCLSLLLVDFYLFMYLSVCLFIYLFISLQSLGSIYDLWKEERDKKHTQHFSVYPFFFLSNHMASLEQKPKFCDVLSPHEFLRLGRTTAS